MGRRISRRVWGTGVVLGIVLMFLVGVVWWGLAASNDPQFQNEISMPSMRGTDTYFVNLWLKSIICHRRNESDHVTGHQHNWHCYTA